MIISVVIKIMIIFMAIKIMIMIISIGITIMIIFMVIKITLIGMLVTVIMTGMMIMSSGYCTVRSVSTGLKLLCLSFSLKLFQDFFQRNFAGECFRISKCKAQQIFVFV